MKLIMSTAVLDNNTRREAATAIVALIAGVSLTALVL